MRAWRDTTVITLPSPRFPGTLPSSCPETIPASFSQVDGILRQAEEVSRRAADLVFGRSVSDLTRSLEPGSWSVAQCLDHLSQTTNAFLPPISEAIARAPRLNGSRALRTGIFTDLFIRNLEPPYRLRFKVLKPLVPRRNDFPSAWAAFEMSQSQLEKSIQSAFGFAIDEVRIEAPVYARFSYNVYGALRMLTAHERRHLWQIEQILNALDESAGRVVS